MCVSARSQPRSDDLDVFDLRKRREIKALLQMGHSCSRVAAVAHVSLSSVRRIAKEPILPALNDAAERKRRNIGRPSLAEPFRDLVASILSKAPETRSSEILRQTRRGGYSGGKTAMYSLIAELRSNLRAE